MNNPKCKEGAAQAAARWMARRMSGEMTQADEQAFESWLAEDPEHRAEWRAYDGLDETLDQAAGVAWEAEMADELETQSRQRRARGWPVRVAAIAAVLVAAIVAPIAVMQITALHGGRSDTQADALVFASATGVRRTIALADGSTALLNSGTQISVSFKDKERRVRLDRGEAMFAVTHNPDRPFVVAAGSAKVRVIGTRFDVFERGAEAIVSVVEGSVRVSPVKPGAGAPVILTAGEQAIAYAGGRVELRGKFDADRTLAWRVGRARYDGAPLGEVISDLNRYFPRPLMLADQTLAKAPVTGSFDIDDRDAAVEALSLAMALRVEEAPDGVIRLYGKEP